MRQTSICEGVTALSTVSTMSTSATALLRVLALSRSALAPAETVGRHVPSVPNVHSLSRDLYS